MSEVGFSGFKKEGQKRAKDLPPRPNPKRMSTKETKAWIPVEDTPVEPAGDKTKLLVTRILSTLLPILGSAVLVGSIAFLVFTMLRIYQ